MKFLIKALLAVGLMACFTAQAQREQNSLTWGFHTEIETLDPYATAKGTVQLVIRNVLENLVLRDPSGTVRPALATSWRLVNETTIEFTLRQGVTFHNGQPFDADDVVYSVGYVKKHRHQGGDIAYAAGRPRHDRRREFATKEVLDPSRSFTEIQFALNTNFTQIANHSLCHRAAFSKGRHRQLKAVGKGGGFHEGFRLVDIMRVGDHLLGTPKL